MISVFTLFLLHSSAGVKLLQDRMQPKAFFQSPCMLLDLTHSSRLSLLPQIALQYSLLSAGEEERRCKDGCCSTGVVLFLARNLLGMTTVPYFDNGTSSSAFLPPRPFFVKRAFVVVSHLRAISFCRRGLWFCRNVELAELLSPSLVGDISRRLEETCCGGWRSDLRLRK